MVAGIGRVGLWTGPAAWDGTNPEHREAVTEVEDLGYGALWIGGADRDLELLPRLLSASTSLVIATGIVSVWAISPADIAATYHRIARRYPDRFLLGLGSSHAVAVEPTGQTYARPYSKLAGFLDELDALTDPVPHADLALAALGPRTIALAGARTAGAHPYLTTPRHTASARELLGQGPLLAPEQKVVLESDPATARGVARDGIGRYLQLPNYVNNLRREGFGDDDLAEGGSDRLVDALVAWGDPDAVARRVTEHHEAGADHVCLQVLHDAPGLPRAEWRALAATLLA